MRQGWTLVRLRVINSCWKNINYGLSRFGRIGWFNSMGGFWNKRGLIIVTVIIVLIVAGVLWYRNQTGGFMPVENPDEFFTNEDDYIAYFEQLREAYKNDPYGGSTPEETLNLFIEALKAGNINAASNLYVLEDQKIAKKTLQIGTENNNISKLISILGGDRSGTFIRDNEIYEFYFFDENEERIHLERLVLNSQTGKWKIESL